MSKYPYWIALWAKDHFSIICLFIHLQILKENRKLLHYCDIQLGHCHMVFSCLFLVSVLLSESLGEGCIKQGNFLLRPSLSPTWNLIYVRAQAKPSSEISLSFELELRLALISNLLSSPSQAWDRFWICPQTRTFFSSFT